MANKKLIEDLVNLATNSEYESVRDVANRALDEIEWLEDQVDMLEQELTGEEY